MSWWDLVIVFVMAAVIFQGYRRGFALRMAGWVGGVIAFFGANALSYAVEPHVSRVVDGRRIVESYIRDWLTAHYTAENMTANSGLYQWVDNVVGIEGYRKTILDQVSKAGTDYYNQLISGMSRALSVPVWHLVLTLFCWLVLILLFVVLGRLIHLGLLKVPLLMTIDSFVGALVSAVIVVVVLGVANLVLYGFVPEGTGLGLALKNSFFGPFFRDLLKMIF